MHFGTPVLDNFMQHDSAGTCNLLHSSMPAQATGGAIATIENLNCSYGSASQFSELDDPSRPLDTCRNLVNSGVDCMPSPTCAPANAGHLLPASFPGSLLQRCHMVPAHASAQPDLSSCDFIASLISAETSETTSSHFTSRAHGPFTSEPVTRAFGHEGAAGSYRR